MVAFLESLTDERFLREPRHGNPWPASRGSIASGPPGH
jgi:hypothetical protein